MLSLNLAILIFTTMDVHALSLFGEFLKIGDLYQIYQIAELKTSPKFSAIW